MSVVFRADASLAIGWGHVIRSLTLAEILRESGLDVEFICREHQGNLIDHIRDLGFEVFVLPLNAAEPRCVADGRDTAWVYRGWLGASEEDDARDSAEFLVGLDVEWLVVDHYGAGIAWEQAMRDHVEHIMVIDDLANRKHDCDLLLDVTLGRREEDYRPYLKRGCRALLGPKYGLLRPQFRQLRAHSLARRAQHNSGSRVLVAMGGSDPSNVTGWVLQSMDRLEMGKLEVDVVLGGGAPGFASVQKQVEAKRAVVRLHEHVEDMASLMADADIAIGAPATMAWERCCLGLPSILIVTENNQVKIAEGLESKGAALNLGWFDCLDREIFEQTLHELLTDAEKRWQITARAAAVSDGLGADRVVEAMGR